MFYKQIILQQGLPFEVKLPSEKITDISQLSEKELNEKLEKAYEDMLKERTRNAKDVFLIFVKIINYNFLALTYWHC